MLKFHATLNLKLKYAGNVSPEIRLIAKCASSSILVNLPNIINIGVVIWL